jgi:hypothetical protein
MPHLEGLTDDRIRSRVKRVKNFLHYGRQPQKIFGMDDRHAAVKRALKLGAVGFDAAKHLVLCQV